VRDKWFLSRPSANKTFPRSVGACLYPWHTHTHTHIHIHTHTHTHTAPLLLLLLLRQQQQQQSGYYTAQERRRFQEEARRARETSVDRLSDYWRSARPRRRPASSEHVGITLSPTPGGQDAGVVGADTDGPIDGPQPVAGVSANRAPRSSSLPPPEEGITL